MKFLLDMGISPRVGMFVKSRGHGAVHLVEVELGQSDDAEILRKARVEGSVLLTHTWTLVIC